MSADGGVRRGMHGPMGGMTPLVGCRGVHDNVEAQLTSLRASLRITSAQEGAWSAYDAAFRAHAGHMGTGRGMGGDGAAAIPVVERLRRHEAMMSQHLASFQALRAAIESLYESLSAEQKAAADALRCHRPF
jgi:hypothetical protein